MCHAALTQQSKLESSRNRGLTWSTQHSSYTRALQRLCHCWACGTHSLKGPFFNSGESSPDRSLRGDLSRWLATVKKKNKVLMIYMCTIYLIVVWYMCTHPYVPEVVCVMYMGHGLSPVRMLGRLAPGMTHHNGRYVCACISYHSLLYVLHINHLTLRQLQCLVTWMTSCGYQ